MIDQQTLDRTFLKNKLYDTLPNENLIPFYFIRKRRTKTGKTTYYLYSDDKTSLILAARKNKDEYTISESATDMNANDPYYAGCLRPIPNATNVYYAVNSEKNTQIEIAFSVPKDTHPCPRAITVNLPSQIKITQKLPHKEGNTYVMGFASLGGIESKKNFVLEQDSKMVFSFQKKQKDEHRLYARYPLSIFQSFALALSMML